MLSLQSVFKTENMGKKSIIYGYLPVVEAMKAGKEIEKILIQKNIMAQKEFGVKKLAIELNIPFQYVPKERMNKYTQQSHQGVIALISPIEYVNLENLLPGIFESGKTPFILVLDKITDVRNLGSIARSAECSGVDAIVVPDKGSAQINADTIKTSAGAITRMNICRVSNLKETILFLKNSGLQIVAATEHATNLYYEPDYQQPLAIIMGSEEKGIAGEYLQLSDSKVKIPLQGEIESLNVAVATGILVFEVVRQREELVVKGPGVKG